MGRSGSGKTNLVFALIGNLLRNRKPFLIFDWKKNYRPLISSPSDFPVQLYTVGRPLVPFQFNPLIPPPGTEATSWLKKLIEILAKATFVGEGVMYLLQRGLDQLYRKTGVYDGNVERYPSMAELVKVLKDMSVKGRAANWMASTERALAALCFGSMGEVLTTQSNSSIADLLEKPVILELDSLTAVDKVFFIESLMLWIHHYRLSQQEEREQFRHAIIIEEAHHILKRQATGSQESITDLLLREIRELGESIILVDQHPSQISLPALGNTYCTFTLNLKSREDVNASSAYLLLKDDEKPYLGRLEVGQAIVKLQGRWPHPFLIQVPHIQLKHTVVTDQEVREIMLGDSTDSRRNRLSGTVSGPISAVSALDRNETNEDLSEVETAFLSDIRAYPFSGVVERYKRLGLSRRKGNYLKEGLRKKGLILPVEIPTRQGKVVLLDCKEHKDSCTHRNPGIVHEYWRMKIAERYTDRKSVV